MKKITLERALMAKEFVEKEIKRDFTFGGSRPNEYEQEVQILENYISQTRTLKNTHVAYAKNILSKEVSREIAEKCFFVNGTYCGLIIQDENNNFYASYEEIINKLGKDIVFLTEQNTWYGKPITNYIYIEELELLMCYGYRAMYDQVRKMINVSESETIFMTKEHHVFTRTYAYHKCGLYEYHHGESDTLMPAIKQMYGLNTNVICMTGNTYVPLDTVEHVNNALKYINGSKKKSGKLQNKIDSLIEEYKLSNVSFEENFLHNTLMNKVVVEKLADNLCVVRWVYCYNDEIFDGMRVYVTDKETYCCKRNNYGEYVRMNLGLLNIKNFESDVASNIEISDLRGTRLQYSAEIIKTIEPEYQSVVLLMCLVDARVEQLFKNGFKDDILSILKNPKASLKTKLKNVVNVNDEAKTFYGWLGVNKYQLKEILKIRKELEKQSPYLVESRGAFEIISDMKKMLTGSNKNDILSIDQETFDKILEIEYEMFLRRGYYGHWNAELFCGLLNNIANNFDDERKSVSKIFVQHIPTIYRMSATNQTFLYRTYRDYLDMLKYVETRRAFKLFPKDAEELKNLHDQVTPIYQINLNEKTKELFVKQLHKVEKLEYRENDDYVVKIPTKPEDLAEEGLALNHCVKSYINKVVEGKTNIVFIRKKEDEEKSFFTVEVDNDKNIVQAHGFANCNVSAVEGLRDFVKEWAKNKHLKIGHIDQIR